MNNMIYDIMSFIRLALYGYVVFVGYFMFRHNGHDRKLEAILVGNIVLAFVLTASNVVRLITDTAGIERAVFLTVGVIFWAMTHLYLYIREEKT